MWLENWSQCNPSIFNISKSTSNALIKALRAQALLVKELLQEGFEYVLKSKLQSDAVERQFSQYIQLHGGNLLVSLKKVKDSEKSLFCQTLIKEKIIFFSDEISLSIENLIQFEDLEKISKTLAQKFSEQVSLKKAKTLFWLWLGMWLKNSKEKTIRNTVVVSTNFVEMK